MIPDRIRRLLICQAPVLSHHSRRFCALSIPVLPGPSNHSRILFTWLAPVLLVLLIFSSCIKEEFNADNIDPTLQINPGVAAPIGWAKYTLGEILNDSLYQDSIYIDGDGFISMIYYYDLGTLRASEMITIPDLSFVDTINNPIGTVYLDTLTSKYISTYSISIPFTINGTSDAKIDSIMLDWGIIMISASTPYPDMDWIVQYEIAGSGWYATIDETFPELPDPDTLEGIMIELDPLTNGLTLEVIFEIWGGTGTISPGPLLYVDISISDIEYGAIYGYLGQIPFNVGPQSFQVEFYSRLAGGNFKFNDPSLETIFGNSFGLPIQISLANSYLEGNGGQTIPINISGTPVVDTVLDYPGPGQEGESVTDNILLVNSNTNLFDELSPSSNRINAVLEGMSNPPGYDTVNFLLNTSQLSSSLLLTLPLDGYANLLLIADTLDFVFGDYYESPPEEIKRLIFRLVYDSQFPVDVVSQLKFYAQDSTFLDSLFTAENTVVDGVQLNRIPGAPDENNDGIAEPYMHRVEVELSRSQIDHISSCHYVVATGEVRTEGYENQNPVKFYSYYFFNTHIGAIAELEMNSDDY